MSRLRLVLIWDIQYLEKGLSRFSLRECLNMKSKMLVGVVLLAWVTMGLVAHAERPDHFKGLTADTLEEAVKNFSEHNQQLAATLDQGELSAADIAAIHELTYTLENALEKINAELTALTDTLEEVHVASEIADRDTVLTKGREYLSTARKVIK
jgi:hypothetical protein